MKIPIIFLFLVLIASIRGEETFGYISNSTVNIGDDIQTIAAKRFLPDNAVAVDREFVSTFTHDSKVKTLISGWFMHRKGGGYWDLPIPPPEKSWPPASILDPFFISVHFTGSLFPTLFSDENIEYLKAHSPIGARDLSTLESLQQRGIPSYFSGCLTLTLENHCKERNEIIYLVDLDEKTVAYIQSRVLSPTIVLSHGKPVLQMLSPEHRLKYAEYILDLYRKAKCVVTTRLHAAMPCLAFETPVLLLDCVDPGCIDLRFTGLLELLWHSSRKELREGKICYDFDNPPANPRAYLPIREQLIKTVTEWVKKTSS